MQAINICLYNYMVFNMWGLHIGPFNIINLLKGIHLLYLKPLGLIWLKVVIVERLWLAFLACDLLSTHVWSNVRSMWTEHMVVLAVPDACALVNWPMSCFFFCSLLSCDRKSSVFWSWRWCSRFFWACRIVCVFIFHVSWCWWLAFVPAGSLLLCPVGLRCW